MWIVIGIVSIWAIMKRKSKRRKNLKTCTIILFLFSLSVMPNAKAQDSEQCINGSIFVTQLTGDIYVFLVNSETFGIPLSGIDTIIIKAKAKTIHFNFTQVKPGIYGIRCFQDLNCNEKLDRGLFGPSEPYGFSWNKRETFPFGFNDISFKVDCNYSVTIKMKNFKFNQDGLLNNYQPSIKHIIKPA